MPKPRTDNPAFTAKFSPEAIKKLDHYSLLEGITRKNLIELLLNDLPDIYSATELEQRQAIFELRKKKIQSSKRA